MKWIEKIAALQDSRVLWILLAIIGLGLEQVAYQIFQQWLYMRPCEQCVYIRFAMVCLIIGGIVGAINPKIPVLKLIGYGVAIYGAIKGIGYSLTLIKIGEAYRSGNPFGVQGCSATPTFPFNLPLHEWFPNTFLPTGDCSVDYPIVPMGAVLSPMQKYLTDLYRDGWFLIPSKHFLDMDQSTLLCFSLILLALGIFLISWLVVAVQKRSSSA
jgi:disulfide bond formation protein DsbB